jgi:hypothetical protein
MWFVNPFFLAGLGAVALPLLIHLLTRDRIQKVAFSTVRFFAKISKRVLRRRKFQEMLLLALRMLLCALLAIAFARPFFKKPDDEAGKTRASVARVIVVDVSASMARDGIWDQVAKEVDEAIKGLSDATDLAGLVTFAEAPETLSQMAPSPQSLRELFSQVKPGNGGTDLALALARADAMLKPVIAPQKEIVLISDFTKVGWRSKAEKLSPGVKLAPRPVQAQQSDNVAIVEVEHPSSLALDRLGRNVSAKIANYSPKDLAGVQVSLTIGGTRIDTQSLNIPAGGSASVRFRHVFANVGNNPGVINVEHRDAVAADNAYCFNTRVVPKIKAVVLNGSPDAAPLQDGSFWIELALDPGGALKRRNVEMDPQALARLVDETARMTIFDVVVQNAAMADPAAIDEAQVVVVANAGDAPPAAIEAIKRLLARGGGVLFACGDRVKADAFNRAFGDIAPCKLRRAIVAPTPLGQVQPGTTLTRIDPDHPVFEEFRRPNSGNLSKPQYSTYWEVTDSQLARVLARFDDADRPAILERTVGGAGDSPSGISMMMVSGADMRWSTFPMHATFPPFVHLAMRYLSVRSEARTALVAGERIAVPKGAKLRLPDGKTIESDQRADALGFYTLLAPSGELVLAVNRPMYEGDPTGVDPGEIVQKAQSTQTDAEIEAAKAAVIAQDKKDEHSLWWYALMTLTALLLVELFVGNKTMRH